MYGLPKIDRIASLLYLNIMAEIPEFLLAEEVVINLSACESY